MHDADRQAQTTAGDESGYRLLRAAEFLISAAAINGMPTDTGREVAFAGRSNAGKSSALNRLTSRRALARTSSTPGRTRLINFFALVPDQSLRLVDLPGYGYARASKAEQTGWARLAARYLGERQSLVGVVLLTDIRLAPKAADRLLIDWVLDREIPLLVLATKADKLSRGAALQALHNLGKTLPPNAEALAFSARTGMGEKAVRNWVSRQLTTTR